MAVAAVVKQGTTPALALLISLPRKPHHADCPTQVYLERQGLLYGWNLERWGHTYDLTDRAFWKIFAEKSVPTCTCKHRQIDSNGHVVDLPINVTQPFLLHFQHDITAPIVGSLTHRIALCLATETGDFTFHYQDLGDPVTHEPGIEHALGATAHECLTRLRKFEEHAAESFRHRPSSRRKSSSSS